MPSTVAMRKCAELIFVPPRFEVYRAASRQIHAIFTDYTPLVKPLSLDEAYLDVTGNLKGIATAWEDGQGNQGADLRGNRPHGLGRNLLQQVPCEARIGLSQAERPVRHHA
jgi:nucleotidyltransferase/DNA polymerase involved in DNA repair